MKKPKSLKFTFILALGLLLIGAAAIYSVWDVFRQIKLSARAEAGKASEELCGDSEIIDNSCLVGGDYVFRRVKWGMSREEIKASEARTNSKLLSEHEEILVYKVKIYKSEADVFYNYDKEKGLQVIWVLMSFPNLDAKNLEGVISTFREMFNEKYSHDGKDDTTTESSTWFTTPETLIMLKGSITKGTETDGVIRILYIRK